MLLKVIGAVVVAVVLIVGVLAAIVATRPAEFRIERSATIAAPAVVFAQVNDFHKWEAWSPFTWAGNDKVGEGRMTITEFEV